MIEAIFLDIDNTLVYTMPWDISRACVDYRAAHGDKDLGFASIDKANEVCGPLDKAFMFDGSLFVSRLRPGAVGFVEDVKLLAPKLYALTAAPRAFQIAALTIHGMMPMFDEIYGRESLGERDKNHVVPPLQGSLLVDDQPCMSMLGTAKLNVMRVIHADTNEALVAAFERHYVTIDPFEGDPADRGFEKAMPEIKRKLGLL